MTKRRSKPVDDQIPHDHEAEACALSCILTSGQDDARRMLEQLQELDFHDLRHVEAFRALITLDYDDRRLDVPSLYQIAKDGQKLDALGGVEYVTATLADAAPSAANFPSYLATLRDRAARRKMLTEAAGLTRQAHDLSTPVEIKATEEAPVKSLTFSQGLHYNTKNDPNTLIGMSGNRTTRFLCRGKAWWIIAPSGIGKSVLLYQMACMFALGRPFAGITPSRPLRIVFMQGENDDGDLAEVIQGVYAGLGLNDYCDEIDALSKHIKVISDCRSRGQDFCRSLGNHIRRHKADIAMLDPMLSFAGIDVSRQDQCSQFLRGWLNPVLEDTGAALISTHHTGKPKSPKEQRGMTDLDLVYQGLGSSELVNWARAVSTVVKHGDDGYEWRFLKRGTRAGATHPDGTPTTSVWLRHSFDKMWWEQTPPPEETPVSDESDAKPAKQTKAQKLAYSNLAEVLSKCSPDGESANAIGQRLHAASRMRHNTVSLTTCRTDVLDLLVESKKLTFDASKSLYFRGPNA